jgi:hypothetical protein
MANWSSFRDTQLGEDGEAAVRLADMLLSTAQLSRDDSGAALSAADVADTVFARGRYRAEEVRPFVQYFDFDLQMVSADRMRGVYPASLCIGVVLKGSWTSYAPLATLGWVEAVGEQHARRVVTAVVDGVRNGKPLVSALREAVGEEQAAELLGVPSASDIRVASRTDGVEVRGERWRWASGGWQALATPVQLVQVFADSRAGRRHVGPAPATVEAGASFTVLDASPAFERSPSDNLWRARGEASADSRIR